MDRSLVPDSPTSEASCNSTQQSSNDSRNNRECNDLFWGSTNKRPSLRSKFSKQKYWKLSAEQREMYNKHLVSQCFPGFPKVIYGLRMESEIAELGNQDEPNKIKVENGQGNLDVINNSPRNETIPEIPVTNSTENTKATLPSPYHEAVPSQTVHLNRYTSETNITNSIPQSSLVEQNTPQSQLSIMFEQTATLCGRVEAIEQQLAKLEKLGYFTPENLYDYSTSNLNNNTKEYFVGGKIISTVDSGNIEQNAMSNRELNSETEHDQNKIVNVIDKHLSEDFAKNSLSSNESLRIDPESKLLSNPGKAGVSECEKHDCLSKGLELYENNSDENVQHGCTEPSQIGNSSQTQNILTFNSATDLTSFLYNSDKKFHTKEAKGIHHACDWILANKQPRITSQIRVCSTLSYNTWWCRLTGSENVILPVIYRLTKEEWVCNIPANATERCVVVAETVNKHQSNIKLLQYSAATSESQSMYQINAIESQLVVLLKYNLGKDWHVTVVLRSVPYASNISEELEKMTGTPDSQQCESTFVQIIKLCSMNGTSDNQFDILFETGTNHQPILQTFDLDIVKEETILNDTNYEVLSEILNYKGEKIKKQHEKKEERQSNTKLVYFDGIELITQNLLGTTLKDSGEENAIHSKKILKQNCELFSAEFNKISYSESEFSEHIVRLLSINRQVENQEIYPQAEITRKHISENTSARKESTPESSSKEVQTQGDSKSNSLNVCKINLPPLLDPSSPEENVDRRFLLDNGCTYKRGHVFESAKSTDTSIDSTGKSTEASIDSTRSSLCKQDNSLLHSEVVTSPNVCSDENGTTILPENVQSVETCKKSSDVKLSNQIEEKFGVRAEYNLLINSNRKEKENKVKTTKTSITTLEKPSEYTRVNQALYSQRYGDNISLSLPTESFTQANESQTAKGEFHSKAETSSVKSDWISAIDNLEPIYSASTDNSKSDNTSKKQENFTLETVAPVSSCANSDTVTKVHTDVSRSGSNERPGVLQEKMESFSENNFSEEISTLTRGNKMNSGEKEICKVSPVPKYGLSPTKAEPEIMETNEPDQLNKNVFENFETDLECKDSSVKKESSKSKTEEVELIPSDKTNKNASFQESKIICSEKKVLVDSNNTKERSKTTEIKETAINVDDSYEQHATLKLTNVSFNEISNRKDRNVSSKHPNIENSTRIVHSVPKLEEISNANKTDESQCKEIKITESIKRTTKYFKEENICTGISNLQANDTNMSFKSTTSGMTKTISKADVSYGQISNSKESPQVPSVTSGSERTKLDEKTVQSTQNDVIVSPSIRDTIKPQNSQQKELENVNQSLQNIQIKKSDILVKNPEISNIHDNKGDITRKELDSATSGVQDYQIHSAQTIKEAKIESRKDERFQRSCKEIMSTVNDGIYEIALEGPIIEEKANQNIVHTSKNELQKSSLITQNQISQTSQKKSPGKEEPKTLANISIPVEMKLSRQFPQSSDFPKGAMQRMEPIKPEATKLSENTDNAKNKMSSVPIQSKSSKEHTVISRKSAGQTIPPISETNRTMNTSVKNEEVLKTDKVKPTISLENPTKCLDVKQDLVSSRRENIKVKSVESTDSCRPNKGNKERLDYNENKNRISNSDKLVTEEKIIGKNKIPINTSENANKIAGKIEVSTESKLLVDKLPTASNDIHTQKNLPDEKVQDKSISNKSNTEKIKSNSKNSDTFVTERSTTIETKFTKNISSETQHETSNFTSSNEKEVVFKDEMQKKSNLPQKSVVCTASDNITSFQNKNEVSVRSEGTLKGTINKEPLKEDAKSTVYVSDNLQLSKNTLGVEDSAKQSKIPTNVKPGTSNVQKDPSTSNSGKSREDCKQPNLSMNKVPNIPLSGINNENKKHLEKHIPTYDTLKNNNTTSNTELVINKQLVKPAQQSNINSPENLKLEISRGKNILPDEKSNQFSMENSSGACLQKRHMKETEIVIPKPSTETEVQSAKSGISTIASQSQTTQVEINNSKGSSKSTKINMPKEGDTSRDSMDCLQLKEKNCKSESVSISLLQESSNISGNKNCIGIQQSKPSKVSSNEEISESKILGNKTIGQEEKKISLASSEKINSKPVQDPISNINELQKHQKQVSGVLTSPQQNIPDSLKSHSKKSEDGKFNSLSASGTSNDNIARNEVKIIQSSSKTRTNLKPQIDTVSRSMSDERKYVSTTDTIKEISSNDTGDKKPSTINPKSVNTSPEIKPTITSPTNIKQLPTASQGTKSIREENKMSPTSNVAFSVDSSSLEPKQLSFTENISERKILGNKETIGQEERKTSTSEKVNSKTVQDKISNINELQKHQQISGVLTSSQQNIPDSLISHSKKSEDGKVSSLPASGTSAPPDIGNDNLAKKEVKNTESSSSRSMSAERKYVSTTDTFKKISSNDTGDKKKSTICPISVNTSAEIKPTITSPTNIKQLPTASQGTKSIQEQKKMSPTSNEPFSVHSSSLETKQLSFTEYMSERKILGNKKTSGQQENKMSLTSPTEKLNSKPVEDPISNINELQIRQQQVSGVLTSPQQNVPDSLKNNSKKSEDCKLSSPSASGTSASPYIGNDNLARKEVKNTESCLKTGTILKPQIDTVNRSMSDERKYVSTTETFKQISSKSSNDTGDKKTSMICPKSENTSPEIKPTITSPTNIKQLPTASQGTKCIQEEKKMSPTSNEAFSVDSSSLVTKQLSFTEYISERKILGNKKTSGQEENKMSLKSSENANSKPIQDPISNINELQKRQQQVSGVLTSPQQNIPDSLKNHSKKSEDGKLSSPSASGTSASPYIGNVNLSRKEVKNTESCVKTGTILKPQIDTVSRSMSDERKYVSTTDTFKQISSKDTGDKKPSMICPKSVNTSPEIKPTITTTNVKQLPTASQETRSTSTDLSQKSEKQLKKTSTCETNKSSSSVKEKPDTSKLPQLGKLSDGNVKSTSLVKENKQGNDKRSQSNATQNDSVIPIKAEQASSTNKNSKQIVSSQTNKVSTSDVKVSSKVVADKQVVPPKENSPKFKTESKVPKKC